MLDSHCSDQWAPVVLGSLPLLNHQSCTNLHNSPPRAQPHQSYSCRMGSVYLALSHSHTQTHTRAHIHIYSTIPGVWRLFFMLIARYLSLWSSEFILQLTSECLQDDNGLIGTLSPSGFCWGTTSSSMWISAHLCHAGDFMCRHVTWRTSCGHLLLLHSVVCKHIFLLPPTTNWVKIFLLYVMQDYIYIKHLQPCDVSLQN